MFSLIRLIALAYSDASIESLLWEDVVDGSTHGMIVSAIAIKVRHWASVRTSPSGGGGRGLSRGARTFSAVPAIFTQNLD